jgi:bifunctional non-homologous end joining protein LigD
MTPPPGTGEGGGPSSAKPDLPDWLEPELATLTRDRFSDQGWIFERKLDGERCLAFKSEGRVRLMTRNQKEDTGTYPEIAQALAAQQVGDFIVDGEIVAFDGGQTRFARLQQRLGVRHPGPDLLAEVPVYYYIFDVLWADDRDVRLLPLRERKGILGDLLAFTGPLRFTEHRNTDGEAYYRQACASGWEGSSPSAPTRPIARAGAGTG